MIETLRRFSLGNFPTPVQRLETLERALGFKSLWIKRDDLSGPLGGGNKVRKLEYIFADAERTHHNTLFTLGPTGSNHVRATTLYGKAAGFEVECLLFKQPATSYSEENYRTICENATRVHRVERISTLLIYYLYEQIRTALGIGGKRYFIPAGGSSSLGTIGYVTAVLELRTQIAAGHLPEPRFIFVPVGTCGTLAGLIVGIQITGLQTQVIGIRVADRIIANTRTITRIVRAVQRLIDRNAAIHTRDIQLQHNHFGAGYASPTPASQHAVKIMAQYENIHLENTYTSKTLSGLIHYVKTHGCQDQPILFWHTYGK